MPEKNRAEERQRDDSAGAEVTSIPAIRHVGPTLESEPGYLETHHSVSATPEAQIAAEAATAEIDAGALEERRFDPVTGRLDPPEPEPLKTRLPGDTSSDPHTDLGPDNATTLQNREERADRRR